MTTKTQPKAAKPKKVAYRFIDKADVVHGRIYELLRALVVQHHEELLEARIALAWNLAWQPDADGRVTLGQCRKASDLERELTDTYDFVILLRKDFWTDPRVTDQQRRALLDHELTHATVKLDRDLEPAVDECQRTVYRIRKHDIEEFGSIIERYGLYKKDLEAFAAAMDKARARASGWIGYQRVLGDLAAVGVDVPLDAIIGWTDEQRRDAERWALVEFELRKLELDATIETNCPAHVAAYRAKVGTAAAADHAELQKPEPVRA